MYRLTAYGKTRLPLPGVPWRDLTDHEHAEAKRRHPGMEDMGYFEHVTAAEAEAPTEEQPTPRGRRSAVVEGDTDG